MPLQQTTFENSVAKGEIAQYEQFPLLPLCFQLWLVYGISSVKIKVCLATK